MSYRPVFNNNCFEANSTLFIPAFKSLRRPTSSNSEATLSGLGSKGPDEREAREELRARREELKKLTDESTMPPTSFQDRARVHSPIVTLSSQRLRARNHHHPSPPIHHHTFSQPRTIQHQTNAPKTRTATSHATTPNANTPHRVPGPVFMYVG
jgi:hypothetical protein